MATGIRSARAWAPAAVAVLCAAGLGLSAVQPTTVAADPFVRRQPQLSEPARALLDGLAVGDPLMGWTVQVLDGPREGQLRIDLARGQIRFALMVARLGTQPESPPTQTEHYAIYYGHVVPPGTILAEGTIRATTHALARRLRAHEQDVQVPGL